MGVTQEASPRVILNVVKRNIRFSIEYNFLLLNKFVSGRW